MEFEVCIDSVAGAIAASKFGAKRVELCSALIEGGLTPSLAMIEACVKTSHTEVYVMIRPSGGGFNYSQYELELMERDIRAAHSVGAHGVVFGVLNEANKIHVKHNAFLLETALKLNLGSTFHRAIDVSANPLAALTDIINLGFERVLTSGGRATAADGIENLKKMTILANGKIEIMAGCGINAMNASLFLGKGLAAIHFTAKKSVKEELTLDMGQKNEVNEEKIEQISKRLKLAR